MAASGRTCSGVSPSRSFRRGSAYPPARQPARCPPGGKAAHCHLVGPEAQLRGVGPHPGQSGRPLQELPGPEGGQHTVGQHKGLYPCGQKGQGHRLSLRRGNALVSPAGEDQHRPPRPVVGQQAGAAPAVYVQPRLRGAPPAPDGAPPETRRQSMPATPFQSTLIRVYQPVSPLKRGKSKKVLTNRACTDIIIYAVWTISSAGRASA